MFRSEIGSGFEDPGGTPPPRIPGSTPPPPPGSLRLRVISKKPAPFRPFNIFENSHSRSRQTPLSRAVPSHFDLKGRISYTKGKSLKDMPIKANLKRLLSDTTDTQWELRMSVNPILTNGQILEIKHSF